MFQWLNYASSRVDLVDFGLDDNCCLVREEILGIAVYDWWWSAFTDRVMEKLR